LVLVADDDLYFFRVLQRIVVANGKRTRGAVARILFYDLLETVAGSEGIGQPAAFFKMCTDTCSCTVVLTQIAQLQGRHVTASAFLAEAAAGSKITIHDIVLVLVHAYIETVARTRVESMDRT